MFISDDSETDQETSVLNCVIHVYTFAASVVYSSTLLSGLLQWPEGVELVFCWGHEFEGIDSGPVQLIDPNQFLDITVSLKAPPVPGIYQGHWRLCTREGKFFGGM